MRNRWCVPGLWVGVLAVLSAGAAGGAGEPKSGGERLVPVTVTLQCAETVTEGEAIPVTVTITNGLSGEIAFNRFSLEPNGWGGETVALHAVDIYRDNVMSNLFLYRPVVKVPDKISGMGRTGIGPGKSQSIKTDLAQWKLRDAWKPGKYSVVMAVSLHSADGKLKLTVQADEPLEFEIVAKK